MKKLNNKGYAEIVVPIILVIFCLVLVELVDHHENTTIHDENDTTVTEWISPDGVQNDIVDKYNLTQKEETNE